MPYFIFSNNASKREQNRVNNCLYLCNNTKPIFIQRDHINRQRNTQVEMSIKKPHLTHQLRQMR